ncbi:hypothetical protein LguiA_031038 [Lonicera macranthoides]
MNIDMYKSLYNAAIAGNIEVIVEQTKEKSADEVRRLRTSRGNNILHLASQFGHTEAVQAILSVYPSLVSEVNSNRDSALHLAARGEHTGVVRALIDYAKTLDQDIENGIRDKRLGILRRKNTNDDTAFHEATRYNRIQVVSMLLEEDDQSTNEYENKLGETLLYLAASRGFHDLVDVIVKACRDPAYRGPNRRTALHGAVICNSRDCVRRILEWRGVLMWVRDDSDRLPIYYAAHLGFTNVVNELLSVDESIGYLPCEAGDNNALMVAASEGHISVMEELMLHCPSCFDAANLKQRNVLHVAIKHEQKAVIEYLLEECPTIVDRLIIQKDGYGNTPLHLLATSNCFVPKLIQHPMADKGALNNEGFTPLDLVIYDDDVSSTPDHAKSKIAKELKRVGAILHKRVVAADDYAPNADDATDDDDLAAFNDVKKMTDNHMVVAALIATVAFTAGFTMPGGYIQSGGQYEGMAVLSTKSIAFQAFIISDTIALIFSTSALFIYFIGAFYAASQVEENDDKFDNFEKFSIGGLVCNMLGLGAMIVAFITGTYAVLQHAPALAIATCIIACCAFLIYSFVTFKTIKSLRRLDII